MNFIYSLDSLSGPCLNFRIVTGKMCGSHWGSCANSADQTQRQRSHSQGCPGARAGLGFVLTLAAAQGRGCRAPALQTPTVQAVTSPLSCGRCSSVPRRQLFLLRVSAETTGLPSAVLGLAFCRSWEGLDLQEHHFGVGSQSKSHRGQRWRHSHVDICQPAVDPSQIARLSKRASS